MEVIEKDWITMLTCHPSRARPQQVDIVWSQLLLELEGVA